MSSVGYVAYIDEAGDDGLNNPLQSGDPRGASEWMVMSAVVVRESNDTSTVTWLKQIIAKLNQPQVTHLHFRKLREDKKALVCREIAGLPIRCFVVMSHKRNMRGYRNLAAEKARVNPTAWFFCWLSRLLLERVTGYCGARTFGDYGEHRAIRIEFSDRGGVKVDDVKRYYRYLSDQSRLGMLHLDRFDLNWSVVNVDQIFSHPNRMRAGLQLADVISSSFYQAVERTQSGSVRPEPAKLLRPRICLRPGLDGSRYGYGLKVMPTWIPPRLQTDQRHILDFYMKS